MAKEKKMSFFKKMREGLDSLTDEIKKYTNENFLDAVTAASAMVAAADGSIDREEIDKMKSFIKSNDALKVFNTGEVLDNFKKWTDQFEADSDIAHINALKAIAKVKKDTDEAKSLMRLVVTIGRADGDFDDDEKRVAVEIAGELGLTAHEFID